ncbi:MAG: primase-helicase zinc-binding domain-containing protein [Planctomycetota bacterium]
MSLQRTTPSVGELKALAAGRWFDILIAAGIDADKLNGKGHPCPKCGGRDRFAAFPNINGRGAVHCRHCFTRGCDPSPGDGIASLQWILGLDFRATLGWLADWLGVRKESERRTPRPVARRTVPSNRIVSSEPLESLIDFDDLAKRFFCEMSRERREHLAKRLSVDPRSLVRLRVGYSEQDQATTWPMVDSGGRCVGLRMRGHDNNKWSYRGGRGGLFVPDGISTSIKRLFVCEGPSDVAALLSIGLPAIGRPSCTGAVPATVNFVRRIECHDVAIVADHDEAGQNGAKRLARLLVTVANTVRIITPGNPGDDARKFVAQGGTPGDFDQMLANADALMLAIRRCVPSNQRNVERN